MFYDIVFLYERISDIFWNNPNENDASNDWSSIR